MRLAFTQPDHLVVVPDYHPGYGLDDGTRAQALCLVRVRKWKVSEAATYVGVHPSTLYKWLSATKGGL